MLVLLKEKWGKASQRGIECPCFNVRKDDNAISFVFSLDGFGMNRFKVNFSFYFTINRLCWYY